MYDTGMIGSMGILPPQTQSPSTTSETTQFQDNLVGFIRKQFDRARDARMQVEIEMLADIRQARSQYSPAKLAAIRQVMGVNADPPYIGITESKMNSAYALLIDILLPPGQFPASIEPTPVPELPQAVLSKIQMSVEEELITQVEALIMSGQVVNQPTLAAAMEQVMGQYREEVEHEVLEEARRSADRMLNEIKDQFAEGGWEDAFRLSLHDLLIGTAIMRGPVLRSVPRHRGGIDPVTGKYATTYNFDIIPTWDRLIPLRFYPAPEATRQNVPWYVYVNSMTRKDLSGLLKDDSYNQKMVRLAIDNYGNGHREVQSAEAEKARLEGRTLSDTDTLIDVLDYRGTVSGKLLMEWGLSGLDPQQEYEALVFVIGNYVIKAVLNPDPVGLNNIYSAGFSEQPDSFWGIGIPRKMRHSQNICNIAARAIVMNIGIASGPLTEMNVDRMWPGENYTIVPWKVVKSTNAMMQEGKAVNFYQPNMVAEQLIKVFQWGEDVADRETGFPRILYSGESRTPTATANTMLMGNAAKGMMAVIRNIDAGLIAPAIQSQVNYTLQYESDQVEYFGDMRVVARGSTSMVAAETKANRLKELLQESKDPVDQPIFTTEIRAEIWREAIAALGLDPKLLGDEDEIEKRAEMIEMQQQQMMLQGEGEEDGKKPPTGRRPPGKATRGLDQSGQPVAGRDNQLYQTPKGTRP